MSRPRAILRALTSVLLLLVVALPLRAQQPVQATLEQVRQAVRAAPKEHPRLLMDDAKVQRLRQRVRQDPQAAQLYRVLLRQAEGMLQVPPVQHIVTGRRLLGESRKAVRRVLTLALAYRLSDDPRFLQRAREEMLAAARFPDWNPSHFLDTAEMSFALAAGYDWLFDALGPADRLEIRRALLEKGMRAAQERGNCLQTTSNWGQVCTGGIAAAALAVMEDEPDLAAELIHRAVNGVPVAMKHSYAPDGTYPEGPGYWAYGTSYNVILIDQLLSALGTDFGLSQLPGFASTAEYVNHATGPSGLFFNYADGGAGRELLPPLYWFANRFARPDWLLTENQVLADYLRSPEALEVTGSGERMLPLALVWMPENTRPEPVRMGLHWLGRGKIPVAMHRTSWAPDALFVGLKGGTPDYHHGQMDSGSFVLDADGVRWAADLGAENYHRIESRGMDLWGREQDSDRWTVFRNNNLSHNTLVIGGQLQRAAGNAPMVSHSEDPAFARSVVDLSEMYAGQAERVVRGVGIVNGREVVVRDRLEGVTGGAVRWGMVTPAEVEIRGPREAILRQQGKQLTLRVLSPAGARLQLFDVATPPAEHDSPNPGYRMIGFVTTPASGSPLDLEVRLTPGGAGGAEHPAVPPLGEW